MNFGFRCVCVFSKLLYRVLLKVCAGYIFSDFMDNFEPKLKNTFFLLIGFFSAANCHLLLIQDEIISLLFFKIFL